MGAVQKEQWVMEVYADLELVIKERLRDAPRQERPLIVYGIEGIGLRTIGTQERVLPLQGSEVAEA